MKFFFFGGKLKAQPISIERQTPQHKKKTSPEAHQTNVVALFKPSNSEIDLLFKYSQPYMWILTEFPINHYIGNDAMQPNK